MNKSCTVGPIVFSWPNIHRTLLQKRPDINRLPQLRDQFTRSWAHTVENGHNSGAIWVLLSKNHQKKREDFLQWTFWKRSRVARSIPYFFPITTHIELYSRTDPIAIRCLSFEINSLKVGNLALKLVPKSWWHLSTFEYFSVKSVEKSWFRNTTR